MEAEPALRNPPSELGHRLGLIAAREHGVDGGQVRQIGTDPEIFELFYREHFAAVERFVVRRVGDRERAADLTAEIFLAAIDSAHRYRQGRGTPRAWLLGIARAIAAEEHRRRGRQMAAGERLRGSALLDEDDAARLDERIDATARSRELYEAIDRLPEAERAVLELVAIDELSLTEAAAAVGVRPVTARVRLHRARRRLRAALEAAQPNPDRDQEDRP